MSTNETKVALVQNSNQQVEGENRMLSRRKIIGWTVPVVAMVMTPRNVFAEASPANYDNRVQCLSAGYYANCDPKEWKVTYFNFGGRKYTNFTAQEELLHAVKGDPYYIVFRQVVAGKLNQANFTNVDPSLPDYQKYTEAVANLQSWMDDPANQTLAGRIASFSSVEADAKYISDHNERVGNLCW